MLLPEVNNAQAALTVAEHIRHALCQVFEIEADGVASLCLDISSSVGVALMSDHADTIGDCMRMADEAMYRAKRSGRNCIRLAQPPVVPVAGAAAEKWD